MLAAKDNKVIPAALAVHPESALWSRVSAMPGGQGYRDRRSLPASCVLVRDPASPEFSSFYSLLGRVFGSDELEPRDVFERELSMGICKCVAMVDPLDAAGALQTMSASYGSLHAVKGGAYGSTQKISGEDANALAVRFIVTDDTFKGTGATQLVGRTLIDISKADSAAAGLSLGYLVAEAVKRSESLCNLAAIDEGGAGMRRIFTPDGREIFYTLPPLAWNENGTPIVMGAREHLMVTGADSISRTTLEAILEPWWQSWYIRPEGKFESTAAHRLHVDTVHETLEKSILAPIKRYDNLRLLSKRERNHAGIACYDD